MPIDVIVDHRACEGVKIKEGLGMERKTPKQRIEMMIAATKTLVKNEEERSGKVKTDYECQIQDLRYILALIEKDNEGKGCFIDPPMRLKDDNDK